MTVPSGDRGNRAVGGDRHTRVLDTRVLDTRVLDTRVLVCRARDGDVDCFNELYRAVAPALYAWADLHVTPTLRSRLDPDDLVQEVCFRALKSLAVYDPDQAPFRTWLFGIANNVLREAARALARLPVRSARIDHGFVEQLPGRTTAITTRLARDESLRRFLQRLHELPDEERLLLIYRGLEGLAFEQVGELLGVTPAAAAKRWQRLRDRIQRDPAPYDLFGHD